MQDSQPLKFSWRITFQRGYCVECPSAFNSLFGHGTAGADLGFFKSGYCFKKITRRFKGRLTSGVLGGFSWLLVTE